MGYQVVAQVLEQISSGLHLGVLLEQRLVIPHGFESMSMAPYDTTSPELRGLDVTYQEATDTTDDLVTFGNGGNGGLLTTADDLAAFFRLLLGGGIVTPAGLESMLSPSAASVALGAPYGLGVASYELDCGTFYGHGGSVNGTVSIALSDRTGERVAVVAYNTRRGGADPGLVDLAEILLCG
jgi:D-alanyl-D-alanine carboxypeptidase